MTTTIAATTHTTAIIIPIGAPSPLSFVSAGKVVVSGVLDDTSEADVFGFVVTGFDVSGADVSGVEVDGVVTGSDVVGADVASADVVSAGVVTTTLPPEITSKFAAISLYFSCFFTSSDASARLPGHGKGLAGRIRAHPFKNARIVPDSHVSSKEFSICILRAAIKISNICISR